MAGNDGVVTTINEPVSPIVHTLDFPSTIVFRSAFPDMTKGESNSARAGNIFIDCAATADMVSIKSSLGSHVVWRIGCRVRIDESCGH